MRPHASSCRRRRVPFHGTTAAVQASTWYPLHSTPPPPPHLHAEVLAGGGGQAALANRIHRLVAIAGDVQAGEVARRHNRAAGVGERVASVGW